ncbi:MAG: hypothetical protein ABIQ18_42735, partial [Umezawaea sp.]
GKAYARLTLYDEAIACFRRAVDLYHAQASLVGEVESLVLLGDALVDSSNQRQARGVWLEAAGLIENGRMARVGPSLFSVDEVRERIARLDQA